MLSLELITSLSSNIYYLLFLADFMNTKKILVTTDFSDESERAFNLEKFGFDISNIEVTLISVFDEFILPSNLLVNMPNYQDLMKEARNSAESRLKELFSKFPDKIKINSKLLTSSSPDIAHEITNFAKENNFDTIVISSHGRGSLSSLIIGSTTQKVIAKSNCPVLVIPPKQ